MKSQESNEIFEALKLLDVEHYLTTNYDYAFEKALRTPPEHLSTEDIYSLRRKRKYSTQEGVKYLWNIHGEIDHPKSIMLGLDHYCGSVSKIESYVKGTYKHTIDGEVHNVSSMVMKLKSSNFCLTSWVDLFFSSNVHIIGLSLDYSETDLWWLLNKRARLSADGLVKNKIYFYTQKFEQQKADLLKSFNVTVVNINLIGNNYKEMYRSAIGNMNIKPKNSAAA
ncbi:SIR2 family protein [Aeromonas salmonicida]